MAPQRSSPPDAQRHPPSGSSLRGIVGNVFAHVARRPLQAAAVAGIATVVLGAIGTGAWVVVNLRAPEPDVPTLETALHQYDAKRYDVAEDATLQDGGYRNPPCPILSTPPQLRRTRQQPRRVVYQFGRCDRLVS